MEMGDVSGDALTEMLVRLRDRADSGELVDVASEVRALPVAIRAALGAVALAAAERPLNWVALAASAGFSRGTAYRHNKEVISGLINYAPALVDTMLAQDVDRESLTELSAKLQDRDATIAGLRERLRVSEAEREMALSYARDLFEVVEAEVREIAAEKARKVRPFRVVGPMNDDDYS